MEWFSLFGGAICERPHPSYQVWTYAVLLQDFNETVYTGDVQLRPCAISPQLQ